MLSHPRGICSTGWWRISQSRNRPGVWRESHIFRMADIGGQIYGDPFVQWSADYGRQNMSAGMTVRIRLDTLIGIYQANILHNTVTANVDAKWIGSYVA